MTGLPPASWAVDPGAASAREVYPGLWRLRLPVPWHHVDHANAYAIPSRDGVVMVDCGIGGHSTSLEALERAAAQAGFALDQISDLVLTHYHSDHIGLMGPIQRASIASALWTRSRNFVNVLQRTQGIGVRPREYSLTKLSMTS